MTNYLIAKVALLRCRTCQARMPHAPNARNEWQCTHCQTVYRPPSEHSVK